MAEWADKYGDVVWAKPKGFPWWPSYVCNPDDFAGTEISTRANKLLGKQYALYYYGHGTFGFAYANNIKPYTAENTAEFSKETVSKKYQLAFADSLIVAAGEVLLPKSGRISWLERIPAHSQKVKRDIELPDKSNGLLDFGLDNHDLYLRQAKPSDDGSSIASEDEVEVPVVKSTKRGRPPKKKKVDAEPEVEVEQDTDQVHPLSTLSDVMSVSLITAPTAR